MCGYALSLARRAKRIDTTCSGVYPLVTPVSTLGITRRKSETGDRCEKGERQRIFLRIAQFSIFNSQFCTKKNPKLSFRVLSLSIKSIYRFYFSCGSTHKIEFAQQIHNSRGRGPGHPLLPLCGNSPCVPRELYKGRKIVPVGRGFSSRFD